MFISKGINVSIKLLSKVFFTNTYSGGRRRKRDEKFNQSEMNRMGMCIKKHETSKS